MVNRVWPQSDEQERRNIFLIMRRDLGTYWRPDGWSGLSHMNDKGEGPWRPAATIIKQPSIAHFKKGTKWESDTTTITFRAYRWENRYRIDWSRYIPEDMIVKAEQLDIPDNGTM